MFCPRPSSEVEVRPELDPPPSSTITQIKLAAVPELAGEDNRSVSTLLKWLQRQRLNTTVEKSAQQQLAEQLEAAGYQFKREVRLSPADIPDFVVNLHGFSVVIEMKAKAQRKAVYRQLERYAAHDSIHVLILFTATAMQLPERIGYKPTFVASMGAGWL